MTTFTWTVDSMLTMPQEGGQTDVVVNVNYTITGVDDDVTQSYSNNQKFVFDGGTFTPYSQLTEQQVIGWIQKALGPDGVASAQATVQGQIRSVKNPPQQPQNQALPWATTA